MVSLIRTYSSEKEKERLGVEWKRKSLSFPEKAQRMIEECKKERLDFGGPKTEKTKGENKGSVRLWNNETQNKSMNELRMKEAQN